MRGLLPGDLLISFPSLLPESPYLMSSLHAAAPPFMHTYRLVSPTYRHIARSLKASKRLFRQTDVLGKANIVKHFWITQHVYSLQTSCTASVFCIIGESRRCRAEPGENPAPDWGAFSGTGLPDPTPCTHEHTKAVVDHTSSDPWISRL